MNDILEAACIRTDNGYWLVDGRGTFAGTCQSGTLGKGPWKPGPKDQAQKIAMKHPINQGVLLLDGVDQRLKRMKIEGIVGECPKTALFCSFDPCFSCLTRGINTTCTILDDGFSSKREKMRRTGQREREKGRE